MIVSVLFAAPDKFFSVRKKREGIGNLNVGVAGFGNDGFYRVVVFSAINNI